MTAATQTYDANGKEAVRSVVATSYSLLTSNPGLAVTCTSSNTDYPTPIPANAKFVVVWFEDASGSIVGGGRVHINASASAISSLTGSDALMGYSPAMAASYPILTGMTYLHLANKTAGISARGYYCQ